MKLISTLFACFFALSALAQDWAPIRLDEKYNYRKDSADVISFTLWVDSVREVQGDTVHYLNTTFAPCDTCHRLTGNPPGWDYLPYMPFFLQRKFRHIAAGHYQHWDTVMTDWQSFQPLGASWLFEPKTNVTATISSASDSLLWGQVLDSVKTFSLSDGGEIIVSKHHGVLFYRRDSSQYRLAGIQEGRTLGEQVPMAPDFFRYEVGDVFFRMTGSGYSTGSFHEHNYSLFETRIDSARQIDSVTRMYHTSTVSVGRTFDFLGGLSAFEMGPGIFSFLNCPSDCGYIRGWNLIQKDTIDRTNIVNAWPGQVIWSNTEIIDTDTSTVNPGFSYMVPVRLSKGIDEKVLKGVSALYYASYLVNEKGWYTDRMGGFMQNSSYPHIWTRNEGGDFFGWYQGLGLIGLNWSVYSYHGSEWLIGYIRGQDTVGDISVGQYFWPTSISPEHVSNKIHAYPNPANDLLWVELKESPESGIISLIDLAGKLLRNTPIQAGQKTYSISLQDLPKGVYSLKVLHNQLVLYKKVVIAGR